MVRFIVSPRGSLLHGAAIDIDERSSRTGAHCPLYE